MTLQMFPQNQSGNPDAIYSPYRDLAHIFPNVLLGIVKWLEPGETPEWVQQAAKKLDVSLDDAAKALLELAKAVRNFHDYKKYPDPINAIQDTDFYQWDESVRLFLMVLFGRTFLGAFGSAIRDISYEGEKPAKSDMLKHICNEALRIAALFDKDANEDRQDVADQQMAE